MPLTQQETWLVRSKTHGSGQLSLLGCLRISHPPLGTSLSPKNRNPSNNHWHLCRTSFGRHLPQQQISTRSSYQAQQTINATHLLTTSRKYCACQTKWLPTRYDVTQRHTCHTKRRCATFETSKSARPFPPSSTALAKLSQLLAHVCRCELFVHILIATPEPLKRLFLVVLPCWQPSITLHHQRLPSWWNMRWQRSIKDVVVRTLISHPTPPHPNVLLT